MPVNWRLYLWRARCRLGLPCASRKTFPVFDSLLVSGAKRQSGWPMQKFRQQHGVAQMACSSAGLTTRSEHDFLFLGD